ncbi:MAG: tetratricopeptide repeat protein [Actinomycetota bacterium]
MILKVSALILLFSSLCVFAQTTQKTPTPAPTNDELNQHLGAAQTYQLTGDIYRASVENNAVVAIALQRLGLIALEEEDFSKAAKYLNDSVALSEDSLTRASLAVAYMRLSENDKALIEAQTAISLNPKNVRAHQILAGIYYSKGDYQNALSPLEQVLQLAPDFDGAYLLGITYLHLKQLDRGKLLFEEIENAIQKNRANLHLMFGRAFEETDYPAEAEREYKQAIALNPKEPKANFYLGFVILQNGGSERLAEAGKAFEQEIALNPQDSYSYFFLGVVASSLSDHQKAVQALQKAILLNPKMGQSYLFLGQSQAELGDNLNAEKNLRRAIGLTSDAAKEDFQVRRAHFLLGRLLIKSGRKEEGEKELAKAREIQGQMFDRDRNEIGKILGQVVETKEKTNPIQTTPTTAEKTPNTKITPQQAIEYTKVKSQLAEILAQTYHNLGVISAQQGNLPDSIEKFAAAARWKPDFAGLDRNWGIVSFRANEFEKAVAPLSRQLKANPKDDLVRRMLGVSFYFTKNFKQAVATLKPIELELTNDAELSYFYGLSLVQSQLNKDAEILFARLSEKNPNDAQSRFYAAQGFAISGNFERAVKEFRAVSGIAPQMARVHYNAGQSLIRLNRLNEAEKEFRQELAINPSDELSKYHLAFTLLEQKIQPDEAVTLLTEAIAAKPDYADAHYQLGKVLIEKGETEKAIFHLEIAARAEPKTDYIRYQLSIAYRRVSRIADADRELKIYKDLKASNRQTNSPMGNN